MSRAPGFPDTEGMVKQWLTADSTLASVLTRPGGGVSIYNAMPIGAPVPSIVARRVGGGPTLTEPPADYARISFDCWGTTRAQALGLVRRLMVMIANLAETGGYITGSDRLEVGDSMNVLWLPDRESDTARYVCDARFVAITAP